VLASSLRPERFREIDYCRFTIIDGGLVVSVDPICRPALARSRPCSYRVRMDIQAGTIHDVFFFFFFLPSISVRVVSVDGAVGIPQR